MKAMGQNISCVSRNWNSSGDQDFFFSLIIVPGLGDVVWEVQPRCVSSGLGLRQSVSITDSQNVSKAVL